MSSKSSVNFPRQTPVTFGSTLDIAWLFVKGFKRYVWWIMLCFFVPVASLALLQYKIQTDYPVIASSIWYQLIGDIAFSFVLAPMVVGSNYIAFLWIKGEDINIHSWLKVFHFSFQVGLVLLITQLVGGFSSMVKPYASSEAIKYIMFFNAIVTFFVKAMFDFASFYIFDKNKNFLMAIVCSVKLFCSRFWFMLGIYIFMLLLMLLSCITLLIGFIWVLPLTTLVGAVIYHRLENHK